MPYHFVEHSFTPPYLWRRELKLEMDTKKMLDPCAGFLFTNACGIVTHSILNVKRKIGDSRFSLIFSISVASVMGSVKREKGVNGTFGV
jgi:hypothetical protein